MVTSWQPDLFGDTTGLSVQPIQPADTHPFLLNIHYAQRIPSISRAYGLIIDGALEGVCTFGTPPSATLLNGIAGPQWAPHTIELNRLCLTHNRPNHASQLVAGAIRQLPKPTIVVSFADTAQHHEGVVYQATNFIYTGLSARFVDPHVKGYEGQHHTSYAHGLTNAQVVEKYGAHNVTWIERSRKHRYLYCHASRTDRRRWLRDLRYPPQPYP